MQFEAVLTLRDDPRYVFFYAVCILASISVICQLMFLSVSGPTGNLRVAKLALMCMNTKR